MAATALVIGILSVVLALLPVSPATRVAGLALAAGAAGAGHVLRRKLGRRGTSTAVASGALWSGLAGLVLGALMLACCQACSGDGEVDPRLEQQFGEHMNQVLEKAAVPRRVDAR